MVVEKVGEKKRKGNRQIHVEEENAQIYIAPIPMGKKIILHFTVVTCINYFIMCYKCHSTQTNTIFNELNPFIIRKNAIILQGFILINFSFSEACPVVYHLLFYLPFFFGCVETFSLECFQMNRLHRQQYHHLVLFQGLTNLPGP